MRGPAFAINVFLSLVMNTQEQFLEVDLILHCTFEESPVEYVQINLISPSIRHRKLLRKMWQQV